ncbi:MAG: hypothetical protein VKJ02_13170 [Snowella sp.]|nr:hypothetical protein [Snowella sp.]
MLGLFTRYGIEARLKDLLAVTTQVSGVSPESVAALSQTLLAIPPDDQGQRGGRSGLNSDGSPLQLCLTATENHCYSRLLGDPGFVLADPKARFDASYLALTEILTLTDSPALASLCDRTLNRYIPKDVAEFARFTSGVLWLGAGLDTPGCAMYVDARRTEGIQMAWDWAERWLTAILPDATEARTAIAALRDCAYLQSIGIEGSNLENVRAKLYWRFLRPTRLDRLGIELLQNSDLATFLTLVIRDNILQLMGIVPSLGFAIATGKIVDVKVDVCGHCLPYRPDQWINLVNRCTQQYGLARLPIAEALEQNRSTVSYLGMGCDTQENLRLNLYLKAFPVSS